MVAKAAFIETKEQKDDVPPARRGQRSSSDRIAPSANAHMNRWAALSRIASAMIDAGHPGYALAVVALICLPVTALASLLALIFS